MSISLLRERELDAKDCLDCKSLQAAIAEPKAWWRLHTDSTSIRIATTWETAYQWIQSFFSYSQREELQQCLKNALEGIGLYPTEEQKILFEKVSLLAHQGAWFQNLKSQLPLPSPILRMNQEIQDSNLMQPLKENGRFVNHHGEKIWSQFIETIRLLFPGSLEKPTDVDLTQWNRVEWEACSRSIEPRITWLGHASMLLQVAGFNLLLDPSFHFVFPCFRRHAAAAIPFEKLPVIDIVGISHNHGDHFEQKTLQDLMPYQPIAFVPFGLDRWFKESGYQKVEGKTWWSQTLFVREGKELKLTAIPAQHGSATSISDVNCTLWMGIVIEAEGKKFYFAGDTGFHQKIFEDVKSHFGPVDAAFLPISPEGEREMHLDHLTALEAFKVLGAKSMIPIHWGAYRSGVEKIEEPILKFKAALNTDPRFADLQKKIYCPKLGETVTIDHLIEKDSISLVSPDYRASAPASI